MGPNTYHVLCKQKAIYIMCIGWQRACMSCAHQLSAAWRPQSPPRPAPMCAWCSAGTTGSLPSARLPSRCTCNNTTCTLQIQDCSLWRQQGQGLVTIYSAAETIIFALVQVFRLPKGVRTTANTQLEWPGESSSSWLLSSPLQGSRCLLQLLLQAHHGLCLAPLYYVCEGLRVTPGPQQQRSAAEEINWLPRG